MLVVLGIVLLIMACSLTSNLGENQPLTPTSTPTSEGSISVPDGVNKCAGLSGELEMQALVGPSEAVGLEPFAVGNIPFSVDSEGVLQGGDAITYKDVLDEKWGSYTVEFDLTAIISGGCEADGEKINMKIEVSGEQLVEIKSEGYEGSFPWSGTHEFDLNFPIEEGARAEGEGWTFVLHLN